MWPVPAGTGLESNICVLLYNICFVPYSTATNQAIRKIIWQFFFCPSVRCVLYTQVCVFGIVFFVQIFICHLKKNIQKMQTPRWLLLSSFLFFYLLAFISNIMHNFLFHIFVLSFLVLCNNYRFTIGDCAGGHRADNREKNRDVLCVPRMYNFISYILLFHIK